MWLVVKFWVWMKVWVNALIMCFPKHANMEHQKKKLAKTSSMCPLWLLNQMYKNI